MSRTAAFPLAQLEGVRKSYGKVEALAGFDFVVRAGEVVALLGPNGAGKTTSVKLLLGLIRPDAGSARLFGQDPTRRSARLRLGSLLQVGEVPQFLTVREHIDLFRSYYPNPLPMARILDWAGLESVQHRLSRDLSGGQRQRLMFALAICGDPEMLFLDEPTVGMDVGARRSFWSSIRDFVARGRSVLLTTHYLEEADALADRIVVLNEGRQVADGTPGEIKARFERKRIRCRTGLDHAALSELPGTTTVEATGSGLSTLVTRSAEETLRALLAADPALADLEVSGVGLEEAFLQLTGHTGLEDAA